MRLGSEIIKEWEGDAREDHKKNIIVFICYFIGWIVASAIFCWISYPLWDKGVIGLIGFLIFCWVASWIVLQIIVRSKRSKFKMIRDIKRFDVRRKEILKQRAIASLNKA